jgi:hypothetical protein
MGEKIFMSSYYDWIVLIVLLVVVTGMWIHAYKKEERAAPIITNLTQTPVQLLNSSISVQERVRGKTGYAKQSLGEPCVSTTPDTVAPNIPSGFETNSCDETKFLECFDGVVSGGGICLKKLYSPCQSNSECTPESDFCMNGYCQIKSGTLNKVCFSDSDCTGGLENSNNVCDPIVGRCRIPQYPSGSGCVVDQQCDGHIEGARNNQVGCVQNTSSVVVNCRREFSAGVNVLVPDGITSNSPEWNLFHVNNYYK